MTRPASGASGLGDGVSYVLRFQSLTSAELDLRFPCDAQGVVDLNALGRQARENYLFARALVGRSYSPPQCVECANI